MDIAGISMAMSSVKTQQSANIAVMKQIMNFEEEITELMAESLAELSVGYAPAGVDVSV